MCSCDRASRRQNSLFAAQLTLLALMIQPSTPLRAQEDIRRIPGDPAGFDCPAVIVSGRPLVHTAQFLPVDDRGALVGAGSFEQQFARVFQVLSEVLKEYRARPVDLVKFNIYVADDSVIPALVRALREQPTMARPAVSIVTTKLPVEGALIAVDAVVASGPLANAVGEVARLRHNQLPGRERMAHSAVLPVGETIYISGQAEPGSDLAEATEATLAGLKRTLDHLNLGLEHVVQLKCFLAPMSEAEQAYAKIEKLFGNRLAPPTSVVEWVSSLPIEIEMIVHAPESTSSDAITHEWLDWLTVSPVYCRYSRIPGDTQIYISGCFGAAGSDDNAQVAEVFRQLQERLSAAGSDLKHMAKATYYVSNEAASAAVNEIRPTLYDPQHPPAASKALVHGVGLPDRSFTLDMIAAPAR